MAISKQETNTFNFRFNQFLTETTATPRAAKLLLAFRILKNSIRKYE
jgi:hypothetical protein